MTSPRLDNNTSREPREGYASEQRLFSKSPLQIFIILLGIAFLIEAFLMLVFSYFLPEMTALDLAIADAALLVLLISPALYFLLLLPLVNNISTLKQMEMTLRKRDADMAFAAKTAQLGYWEYNIESDEFIFSDEFYALLKTTAEQAGGYRMNKAEYIRRFVHPDDADHVGRDTDLLIESNDPHITSEIESRIICTDGEVRWLFIRLKVDRDTQGKAVGLKGVSLDITEKKLAHDELKAYQNHLEELIEQRTADLRAAKEGAELANRAKSDFLSRMSHELRTPLNAILGFGQLLRMEQLSESQQEYVKETLNAGYHLLTLVNEALDLAAIESGKLDIAIESINLSELVQSCVSLVQLQADARNIDLINHVSNNDYMVQADSTRLKQVLLNLLSNAVKYNRDQGHITVDSKIIDNQHLRITVTDTSTGLSKHEIDRIFTPFERLDAAKNIEGTGIGLVISKYLAELMGGAIGVDSIKGEGSTFWVELVLTDEVEQHSK